MSKSNFNFFNDIILENDAVLMRPLVKNDFHILLPFSINEPTLWQYSLTPADGRENLERYIDLALKGKSDRSHYPWIVFDKSTQEYAGSTRYYDYQPSHKTTQLGYTWYGSRFWGTGLNKNCKHLLLSYAFDHLGLERVEFRADANNARSIAAMKSLGCVEEGVLRNNCASPTGRRSSIVLSILKDEWDTKVKEQLTARIQAV